MSRKSERNSFWRIGALSWRDYFTSMSFSTPTYYTQQTPKQENTFTACLFCMLEWTCESIIHITLLWDIPDEFSLNYLKWQKEFCPAVP